MFGCSGVCSHAYMWCEELLLLYIVIHSIYIVSCGVRCCDACLSVCPHLHMWFSKVSRLYFQPCTTVACLPPISSLEKCRVMGHNPHFFNALFYELPTPKVGSQAVFSKCVLSSFSRPVIDGRQSVVVQAT